MLYQRCDEYHECIGSYAIAGYLRFRSSFFLIAIFLFIFYTVCVILSTTVNIWNPVPQSQDIKTSSGNQLGQAHPDIPATNLGNPPGKDNGTDLGYPLEKDPVIDLGKPLGTNPVIDLGYSKYKGVTHSNGVTKWLGIRYAAPPIGDLRFAEPQNPLKYSGVQKADRYGKKCWGYRKRPDDAIFDEDCLFLDIYAPANATTGAKLPVFFFMPAGGFNFNAGSHTDRSGLVKASKGNIIVVSAHYRVGPYGFIASEEIVSSKTASTNNGLKDQRKALEWVQKHINKLGGDPDHVVIGGASAGGASVAHLLTAYGGRDDGLFHAAGANSASFGPVLDVAESQYQYDYLVDQLNCDTAADTLACLRSKPASEIQLKNINIPYPQAHVGKRTPIFMWNPVMDDDMVQDHTYRAFYEGKFVRVPAIFGDDTNGGSGFAPKGTSTLRQVNSFLAAQWPALTRDHLDEIDDLYAGFNTHIPNRGELWHELGTAYGEMRYMCPNMFAASAMARYKGSKGWNYRYNVEVPALMENGYGVPHIAEQNALWGAAHVKGNGWKSYLDENKAIVAEIRAYWLSFIRTYNPNTLRLPGSPEWEEWSPSAQRRLVLQTNQTRMEVVDAEQRKRCEYLTSIAVDIQQ